MSLAIDAYGLRCTEDGCRSFSLELRKPAGDEGALIKHIHCADEQHEADSPIASFDDLADMLRLFLELYPRKEYQVSQLLCKQLSGDAVYVSLGGESRQITVEVTYDEGVFRVRGVVPNKNYRSIN